MRTVVWARSEFRRAASMSAGMFSSWANVSDVQLGDHEFGFTGEPRFFVFN